MLGVARVLDRDPRRPAARRAIVMNACAAPAHTITSAAVASVPRTRPRYAASTSRSRGEPATAGSRDRRRRRRAPPRSASAASPRAGSCAKSGRPGAQVVADATRRHAAAGATGAASRHGRDPRARARRDHEPALGRELPVGVADHAARDVEVGREHARGRQPLARHEPPVADRRAQLVLDLALQRTGATLRRATSSSADLAWFADTDLDLTPGPEPSRTVATRMNGWSSGRDRRERRRRVVPGQRRARRLPVRRRPADPLRGRRADPHRAAQGPARPADAQRVRPARARRRRRHGRLQPRLLGAVEQIGATNTGVIVGASPGAARARRRHAPASLLGCAGSSSPAPRSSTASTRASRALGALLAVAALARPRSASRCSPRRCSRASARCASPPGPAWLATVSSRCSPAATSRPRPRARPPRSSTSRSITTALAFVLWFGAVQRLGAGRAGLLVGLMPVAAVAVDAALNGDAPSTADLAGTALVAAGVALGARPARARAAARAGTRAASAASSAGTSSTCRAASSSPAAAPPARSSRR